MIKSTKRLEPYIMSSKELEKTLDALENEVLEELNKGSNPYKIYSVVFPYQVTIKLPDDDNNTEVIINTKTEEFYTARNEEDVLLQKELSDSYSKIAFTRHITRYVLDKITKHKETGYLGNLTYTGKPEITELDEERLSNFERELFEVVENVKQ